MHFTLEQKKGVEHEHGHAIINACPGSGKTTVIAALIINLLSKGYIGSDMLVLMFGSDAQKHFVSKLKKAAAGMNGVKHPEVLTFHALCLRLCKYFSERGLMPNYALETSDFTLKMMASYVLKSHYTPQQWKLMQNKNDKVVDLFITFIDLIKSGSKSPKQVASDIRLAKDNIEPFTAAFRVFEKEREKKGIRFFSDLIYDVVNLLNENQRARDLVSNKKKYIFVDEFQDINEIQYSLLKHLAGDKANAIVIGDVDQSIYQWRGSDPEFMNSYFTEDFPGAKEYQLTQTFRYGHELTIASNMLIGNNYFGGKKRAISVAGNDTVSTTIDIVRTPDRGAEASKIVIKSIESGLRYDDVAILCRLYSDVIPIQLEFTKLGIPSNFGKFDIFSSNEFTGMMSLLKTGSGKFKGFSKEDQEESISSMLKFPYIGLTNEQINFVSKKLVSLGYPFSDKVDAKNFPHLKPYLVSKLFDRALIADYMIVNGKKVNGASLIKAYIERTELIDNLRSMALTEVDAEEACRKVDAVLDFFTGFELPPYETYMKVNELKLSRISTKELLGEVQVMSIHKAKGLEWPVVVLANAEENQFPYIAKGDNKIPCNIQEERRLFFVAATRAINSCYVLSQSEKMGSDSKINGSMFLDESQIKAAKKVAAMLSSGAESELDGPYKVIFDEYKDKLLKVA